MRSSGFHVLERACTLLSPSTLNSVNYKNHRCGVPTASLVEWNWRSCGLHSIHFTNAWTAVWTSHVVRSVIAVVYLISRVWCLH